jgi:hypothetical protein
MWTLAQFAALEDEHTRWLKVYHNLPPRDPSRPRPTVPTGTINSLLLTNEELNWVYQWMLDEIEWFTYQFL